VPQVIAAKCYEFERSDKPCFVGTARDGKGLHIRTITVEAVVMDGSWTFIRPTR